MQDCRDDIAIIGMTARYPGARNVEEFWRNLRDGVESISFFSDEQLISAGVNRAILARPDYVKAGGIIEDADLFDASFFGFTAREAELMDPQQRIFLECAWEALESSGYDAETHGGLVGIYAGVGANFYLVNNIYKNSSVVNSYDPFEITILNDKDFLTTRVAYKLNLKGPALSIQTACSSSLVAVHLACQSLLSFQCDIALAGGIRVRPQQQSGYLYREGMTVSPDGHCRAFDAQAGGTVRGNGVGIVVLKRLAEALKDRDHVYAVVKGSAVNNDGNLKVGYTAPSIDGQADVIAMAQAAAGIEAETIGYVEAHGTGTALGDPIEIAALTQAFRAQTPKRAFCAIGSVKTNIGHTEAAAGVAGLIKAALALKRGAIPPSLHYSSPNPKIDFEGSPFYVNTRFLDWKPAATPRRAGVSSFGVGGTNAHVVLQEAPLEEPAGSSRRHRLLVISAQTDTALDCATANLLAHLKHHTEVSLGNVAYTLQVGRKQFTRRRAVVCQDVGDAIDALETRDSKRVLSAICQSGHRAVVFMFPGQGSQYVNMAREVYRDEPAFREQVDFCCEFLKAHLDLDLREALYPKGAGIEAAAQKLTQTIVTQPALFVIEYALARLLMDWGVRPQAMIGHSIGEYVAACLASVFSLEDGLTLVAARGRLMNQMPPGAMIAVPLSPDKLAPLLGGELSIAAHNGPSLCVVSGETERLEELEKRLREKAIEGRRLETSHAFHSHLMNPALKPFTEHVRKVRLSPPKIPYLSNVTGSWITEAEATDPNYWARQMRQTVRLSESFTKLLETTDTVLLELGPGRTLGVIARQHTGSDVRRTIVSAMRHAGDKQSDTAFLLGALGRLWLAGAKIDWPAFNSGETLRRVPLPTYPFERRRYWIEPTTPLQSNEDRPMTGGKKADVADWFYVPSWKRSTSPLVDSAGSVAPNARWLLFADIHGLGMQLAARLSEKGQDVLTVVEGDRFRLDNQRCCAINPREPQHYSMLMRALAARGSPPTAIVHLWGIGREGSEATLQETQDRGFFSLLYLAQALGDQRATDPLRISVITSNMHNVTGEESALYPGKATILGPCKVFPWEFPNVACRSIDISFTEGDTQIEKLGERLTAELVSASSDDVVAYRGGHRWVQIFEPIRLEREKNFPARLRRGGVYLITGGLGGLGLEFAEYLARTAQAKLVLTGRSGLPPGKEWEERLASAECKGDERNKIERLMALETHGAEILVMAADVTEVGQMKNVVKESKDRFGEIHGVIHAAGVFAGELMLSNTRETTENVLAPKIKGTRILEDLFRNAKLDFFVLCSSLSAILGGPGRAAYGAANSFLDAFANCRSSAAAERFTVSINWDAWRSVGMAANAKAGAARSAEREGRVEKGITPGEGIDALARILGSSLPQVLVTPRNLERRLEEIKDIRKADDTGVGETARLEMAHPRPELSSLYVAPGNEVEKVLAAVWQAVLGIESVGVRDNFFELGGHSLMATQIVSRLRNTFHLEVPLRALFESQTIEQLAAAIMGHQDRDSEKQDLEEVLFALESLPDEALGQVPDGETTPIREDDRHE